MRHRGQQGDFRPDSPSPTGRAACIPRYARVDQCLLSTRMSPARRAVHHSLRTKRRPEALPQRAQLDLFALSTFSSVSSSELLCVSLSQRRTDGPGSKRAPRHAPPLPRAAPGRPLQGLTSWPTPWTAQQAACGSLARATSAVEHAFALSGAARRAAPGSGRGCPLHRRGSRVPRRGRPWVCAAAADVYERRSTEC